MRTLYMRGSAPKIAPVVSASMGCKLILLLIESWPKTSYLKPTVDPLGPVDVAGPLSRAFLWWLNSLLLRGFGNILSLPDLYPLDQDLYAEKLRAKMQVSWEKSKWDDNIIEIRLTRSSR